MASASEDKYEKQLAFAEMRLDEIMEEATKDGTGDVAFACEQQGQIIKRMENAREATVDSLMEAEKDINYIKQWTAKCKASLQPFKEARLKLKNKMDEINENAIQEKLRKELFIQQKVNEEQLSTKHCNKRNWRWLLLGSNKEKKNSTERNSSYKSNWRKVGQVMEVAVVVIMLVIRQ